MASQTQQSQDQVESLLVRTIQEVLEGRADDKRLNEVLEASRKSLHEHQDAFNQTMDGLTAEVQDKIQPLMDSADDLFGAYSAAMDQVGVYLKTKDKEQLYAAGSLASRAAYQLDLLFMQLRNAALAAQGPTDIPNLNLILIAYQGWMDGKDQGEHFRELVQAERIASVGALQDLEKSPDTADIALVKEAFDAHLRCMNRMAIAFDAGKKDEVKKELETAKATFQSLQDRIPAANLSQRTAGPTKDPEVNMVLSLAKDFQAMNIHESVLINALGSLYNSLKESREAFEQATKGGVEGAMLTEEIEKARQAYELQETALKEFAEFFENRENLVFKSATTKLQESAERLYSCYEQMQSIAEREGKTLCIRCSHYNPANRNRCEKCGAPLAAVVHQQATSTFQTSEGEPQQQNQDGPVLTPNMVRLYTAVNNVHEGQITDEEFLAELQWFESVLDKHGEYEMDEPALEEAAGEEAEAAKKALDELEQAFTTGYGELLQALELFRKYPESHDKADLEEGTKLADSGARKIAAVREATKSATAGK